MWLYMLLLWLQRLFPSYGRKHHRREGSKKNRWSKKPEGHPRSPHSSPISSPIRGFTRSPTGTRPCKQRTGGACHCIPRLKAVQALNREDFEREREDMASRIFSMRSRLYNSAMKRGQMQTAANVLDSLARMVGCDQVEESSTLPEIHVKIEKPE